MDDDKGQRLTKIPTIYSKMGGTYSEVGCTPTTMFDAVQTKQYFILRNSLESS